MKEISAYFVIETEVQGMDILKQLEKVGRTCYKSEDKITDTSAVTFVKNLIARGHEAMIEHYSLSVRVICDRGVTHEIVRHRLASFAQESTRYCNYSKDKHDSQITVIKPLFWPEGDPRLGIWRKAMADAESYYMDLLAAGATAQEARSVLPNSLKTEIVITANLREWRHFFRMRAAATAHPQMQEIARPLLAEFQKLIPIIFDDLN